MTDETYQAYVTAFGAEHHELRRLVHALHGALREEQPWSRDAATKGVELLAELHAHLEHHFAQEEEGGYLEEALALAPRFSTDAANLLRQHPQMLDKMRLVRTVADRAVHEPAAWPQLMKELHELIKGLTAHEGSENKIVQQAFNTGLEDLDD